LLVWGITAVSLVAAVATAVVHWRRHRAPAATRLHGISFYLDDESVMDLYRQHGGKYKAALRQEVQERISSNREAALSADLAPVQAGAKRGVNTEVFRSYIENAEPITVIGIVIDVLDREDDIVNVDLRKQEVISNRALDKALDTDDDERPTTLRLRDLDTFVSIRGLFHLTDRTPHGHDVRGPLRQPHRPRPGSPDLHGVRPARHRRPHSLVPGPLPRPRRGLGPRHPQADRAPHRHLPLNSRRYAGPPLRDPQANLMI